MIPKYERATVTFNGGSGALLCNVARRSYASVF